MNVLSIEAATAPPSVALAIGGQVYERRSEDPRAQADGLLSLVRALLDEHGLSLPELDGLAVGRGPGSFTGLRVAASVAQGLAYSTGLPVANVSSLAALAQYARRQHSASVGGADEWLVCVDARKQQVYCARFSFDELGVAHVVSSEAVLDPDRVIERFSEGPAVLAGDGFEVYPSLASLDGKLVANAAMSAAAVAWRAISGAVPFEAAYHALPRYVRDNVTHGS